MQDPPKIHQVVDAPPPRPPSLPPLTQPTTPLHHSITLEDGNPLLPNNNINPGPLKSVIMPVTSYSAPPRKNRSCFCKCICWTISLLLILIIIVGVACGIVYIVFQPKIPDYSVETLRISDLRLNADMTLYAEFDVKITAKNPNEKIGIYYEKGGKLSVWYTKTKLCEGSIPKFYQGRKNTTKLDIGLTGRTQYGSTLMDALQQKQQTGSIPLDLKVDAPVAIEMGNLKLKKVRFLVGCKLVVDSLSVNNLITITTSNCGFKLKF